MVCADETPKCKRDMWTAEQAAEVVNCCEYELTLVPTHFFM